jgi:2-dehydropantoate 2-reductase
MRYIVYGAGGIGAPLGAYLWESGRETVLIARGAHLKRIQADGLTLITPDGGHTVRARPRAIHPRSSRARATRSCSR